MLEELNIDMIMDVPTSDPLHLLELGIMKTCLVRWVFGQKGFQRKLSKAQIELASRLLSQYRNEMPMDFHRKVRTLNSLRQWKGVEFRAVLLYVGVVLFKKILDDDLYEHFLSLVCAVRICSCSIYRIYQGIAKKIFDLYIKNYVILYGEFRVGSNVHNLAHIVEDMQYSNIGNLMSISTYKFENCLRLLGLQLKHGYLPLEQVSRRIIESIKNNTASNSQNVSRHVEGFEPKVLHELKQTSLVSESRKMFQTIRIKPDFTLSSRNDNDAWFLTNTNDIVKMKYVVQENNTLTIVGCQIVNEKRSFFEKPIESSKLDIYTTNKISDELSFYCLKSIKSKMMRLSYDQNFVFLPLLHTIENLQI